MTTCGLKQEAILPDHNLDQRAIVHTSASDFAMSSKFSPVPENESIGLPDGDPVSKVHQERTIGFF